MLISYQDGQQQGMVATSPLPLYLPSLTDSWLLLLMRGTSAVSKHG